jgi:hypothetical protein
MAQGLKANINLLQSAELSALFEICRELDIRKNKNLPRHPDETMK